MAFRSCRTAGGSSTNDPNNIAGVAPFASEKLFNGFTGSTFFRSISIHQIHLVKFYLFINLRHRAAVRSIM